MKKGGIVPQNKFHCSPEDREHFWPHRKQPKIIKQELTIQYPGYDPNEVDQITWNGVVFVRKEDK